MAAKVYLADHALLFVRENCHCLNQGADQWKNQQRRENRPYVNLDKNQQRRENHLENLHVDQEYDLKKSSKIKDHPLLFWLHYSVKHLYYLYKFFILIIIALAYSQTEPQFLSNTIFYICLVSTCVVWTETNKYPLSAMSSL
jgi:hypothetical protein